MKMRLDLHIHSCYSPDSSTEPKKIIELAKQRGLDGVAIADHNTVGGGLKGFEINEDPNFVVIPAAEYATEYGHVVGLFIKEEIFKIDENNGDAAERRKMLSPIFDFKYIIKAIRAQNGIAVLAHPYQSTTHLPEHIFKGDISVDAVEGFNSRAGTRANPRANVFAKRCAEKYNLPSLGGSDSHLPWEIGRAYTVVDLSYDPRKEQPLIDSKNGVCIRNSHNLIKEAILAGRVEPFGKHTFRAVIPMTEWIKALKRKTYHRIPKICVWFLFTLLGPVSYWIEVIAGRIKKYLRENK